VGILHAIQLGAPPFHAGVRRALDEMDAVYGRQPHQIGDGEFQRPVDEAMQ